jgi:dihydroflavonol-4-reductase
MAKLNLVITGATGFVGQHFLESIDYNRYNVRIISRSFSKSTWADLSKCEQVVADLADVESLKRAFAGQDLVVNIAAEIRNESMMEASNIIGVQNLVDAAVFCQVPKIVHLSSVGVVGMQYAAKTVLVDEAYPCDPKNRYEITKLKSEEILLKAAQTGQINCCILRPTNVFGEHHPFNALLNLCQQLQKGRPAIYSEGAMVNYVYVKDLVEEIKSAFDSTTNLEIRNVGTAMSLKDFYTLLAQSLLHTNRLVCVPSFLIRLFRSLGINKLNAISNKVEYVPHNSFLSFGVEEGIKRSILFYKSKGVL